MDPTPPGLAPINKKSYITSARELIGNHKKSCIAICVVLLVIAVLLIVCASNSPDGFVAKYVPAFGMATWGSPDMKLLKKNHTGDTRRCLSRSAVADWLGGAKQRGLGRPVSMAAAVECPAKPEGSPNCRVGAGGSPADV